MIQKIRAQKPLSALPDPLAPQLGVPTSKGKGREEEKGKKGIGRGRNNNKCHFNINNASCCTNATFFVVTLFNIYISVSQLA